MVVSVSVTYNSTLIWQILLLAWINFLTYTSESNLQYLEHADGLSCSTTVLLKISVIPVPNVLAVISINTPDQAGFYKHSWLFCHFESFLYIFNDSVFKYQLPFRLIIWTLNICRHVISWQGIMIKVCKCVPAKTFQKIPPIKLCENMAFSLK